MRLYVSFKYKYNINKYIQQKNKILKLMLINKHKILPEEPKSEIILYKKPEWIKTNTPDNIHWLYLVSDLKCQYIYALSNQGVYKSNDYGNIWKNTLTYETPNISMFSICCDMTGKHIVVFAVIITANNRQNMLYYSNNFGEIWNVSEHTLISNDYLISITYNS